ncbi:MAG: DUF3817 domain-containing protein [Saprospiraceae bacterium]
MKNLRRQFIQIGHAEGVSYLVLLLIAMPLKYMADMPQAVKIVGSLHGVLFVLYMIYLLLGAVKLKWPFSLLVKAFLLSLIPTGTFFLERLFRNAKV